MITRVTFQVTDELIRDYPMAITHGINLAVEDILHKYPSATDFLFEDNYDRSMRLHRVVIAFRYMEFTVLEELDT